MVIKLQLHQHFNGKRKKFLKEYRQDKRALDSETLHERLKHHEDAVKNLKKEIQSLKKDEKEDKKDVKDDEVFPRSRRSEDFPLKSSSAKTKKEWDKIDTKELKQVKQRDQKSGLREYKNALSKA